MKIATLALTTLLMLGVAAPANAQARIVLSGSDGHVQVFIGERHRGHNPHHSHYRDHRSYPDYGRHRSRHPTHRDRLGHSRRQPSSRYYRVRYPDYGRHPVRHPPYGRN